MKKMRLIIVTLVAMLMFGGAMAPAMTASAAKKTGYSRIEKWKIRHVNYKVKNKKGHTYTITGKAKNVKRKTNHYLKNYAKKTWKRTKITQVKHKGNWMVYYYMTTKTKHKTVGGWVKLTDMKRIHTSKGDEHHLADFDTWYRHLSQKMKNYYPGYVQDVGATNADGSLAQFMF